MVDTETRWTARVAIVALMWFAASDAIDVWLAMGEHASVIANRDHDGGDALYEIVEAAVGVGEVGLFSSVIWWFTLGLAVCATALWLHLVRETIRIGWGLLVCLGVTVLLKLVIAGHDMAVIPDRLSVADIEAVRGVAYPLWIVGTLAVAFTVLLVVTTIRDTTAKTAWE